MAPPFRETKTLQKMLYLQHNPLSPRSLKLASSLWPGRQVARCTWFGSSALGNDRHHTVRDVMKHVHFFIITKPIGPCRNWHCIKPGATATGLHPFFPLPAFYDFPIIFCASWARLFFLCDPPRRKARLWRDLLFRGHKWQHLRLHRRWGDLLHDNRI